MTPGFRHVMLRSQVMPARQAEPVTSSSIGASTEGDSEAAVATPKIALKFLNWNFVVI